MNKPRPDSPWNNLTPEQREKLEGWLFDEGLTYRETLERAEKELGISSSIPSLARFYLRIAGERKAKSIRDSIEWFNEHADNDGQQATLEKTVLRMITVKAYEMAVDAPEKFKGMELYRLMRLILQARQQASRAERLKLDGLHLLGKM